eukprot:10489718-Alexandrium_andersonii.AAC.1
MRASLLIGHSCAPSCAPRLSRSSHFAAHPWLAVSSRMLVQTMTSSSADRQFSHPSGFAAIPSTS